MLRLLDSMNSRLHYLAFLSTALHVPQTLNGLHTIRGTGWIGSARKSTTIQCNRCTNHTVEASISPRKRNRRASVCEAFAREGILLRRQFGIKLKVRDEQR